MIKFESLDLKTFVVKGTRRPLHLLVIGSSAAVRRPPPRLRLVWMMSHGDQEQKLPRESIEARGSQTMR